MKMNSSEIPTSINQSASDVKSAPNGDRWTGVSYEAIAELIPIAVLITLANSLVLVIFAKRKELRTPQNFVLFSLAVCDLMTGLINIPFFIIVVFTPVVTSVQSSFYLFALVNVMNNFTAISSCYHILIATTEKYLAVVRPVAHRMITKRTVVRVLSAVWGASLTMAFIPFAWISTKDAAPTEAKLSLGHVIFCLVAVFFVPYAFMIFAFVVIFRSILKKGRQKYNKYPKSRPNRQAAMEKRCLVLFATMATVFAVCWLPWFILTLLYRLHYDSHALEIPSHVFVLVRYATSILNPLLYSFFRRDFRVALKSFFNVQRSRCVNSSSETEKAELPPL